MLYSRQLKKHWGRVRMVVQKNNTTPAAIEVEMKVFYEGDSLGGIPKNIQSYVDKVYTSYQIKYLENHKVRICVPVIEENLIYSFTQALKAVLTAVEKENSVLASKLAHYHDIRFKDFPQI